MVKLVGEASLLAPGRTPVRMSAPRSIGAVP